VPDNFEFNQMISMNELVSCRSHLAPGNLRISILEGFGQILRCLAYDFQDLNGCEGLLTIAAKSLKVNVQCCSLGHLCVAQNIMQVIPVISLILQTATTSARMRFPIYGRRVFFVTKSTLMPTCSLR